MNYFSTTYKRLVDLLSASAADTANTFILEGTEKLIKEELVRCIWFGQHIKKRDLFTDNGLRMEILSPGWWNSEGGPDFKHAEFLLEGKGLIRGDVEVHVFASDWKRHQHDRQDTYTGVCLHVVMWNDREGNDIRNSYGRHIPQLTLAKYLEAELEEIIDVIDIGAYLKGKKISPGYCKTEIANRKDGELIMGSFLDYAGDQRIIQKAKRYEKWLETHPFEQIFYEAVMESLGYKNNKHAFRTLAKRLPLKEIRCLIPDDVPVDEKRRRLQSLLLGMGGLLQEHQDLDETYDEETDFYKNDIIKRWNMTRCSIKGCFMSKEDWNYSGIRPANLPERRIAAMANILSGNSSGSLFQKILQTCKKVEDYTEEHTLIRTFINDVESIFLNIYDPFWSYHYTLHGKKLTRKQKLIGKEKTSDIIINAVFPVMLVYARRHQNKKMEAMLHLVYRNYPPGIQTSVTKFMNSRILGLQDTPKKVINSARRQQGLYQIFKDFCENDNTSCDKCAFYVFLTKN